MPFQHPPARPESVPAPTDPQTKPNLTTTSDPENLERAPAEGYGYGNRDVEGLRKEAEKEFAAIEQRKAQERQDRARDEQGRFVSQKPATPTEKPVELDAQLVELAKRSGLADEDIRAIPDNRQLYNKINVARTEAAQKFAGILNIDITELADYLNSRSGKKEETKPTPAAEPAKPVEAPKPFELTLPDEEDLHPSIVTAFKQLAEQIGKLSASGGDASVSGKVAELEKALGQLSTVQQQQQQAVVAQTWDEAAESVGLSRMFGKKPSEITSFNPSDPATRKWVTFDQTYMQPAYQQLRSQYGDGPATVKLAMQQALDLYRQDWSVQATPHAGNGNMKFGEGSIVAGSERRAPQPTAYTGNTYEDMLADEKQKWLAAGGSPYRRQW